MNNNEHFDVGLLGMWQGCNYGSIATYYALNKVISSMGKSVLMIEKPYILKDDPELKNTHSRLFAKKHYNISKSYKIEELPELNNLCDAFVLGSDQVWNYGINNSFKKSYYFDFVKPDKKKIAYAASFGHDSDFTPLEQKPEVIKLMSVFDGISVRENDGVDICKNHFGIRATQVLDPVFLPDIDTYTKLIESSSRSESEPFLLTYILDITPEKREAIFSVSKKLGNIKVINILDGIPWRFEHNKKEMDMPNCIENISIEDWLYYFSKADYILTDSCHGASFAMIFNKPYIAIPNKIRGLSRFTSLADTFSCQNRFITDPKEIDNRNDLFEPINYNDINSKIFEKSLFSKKWLEEKLREPKKSINELIKENVIEHMDKTSIFISSQPQNNKKEVTGSTTMDKKNNPSEMTKDFLRCKMLVTLLRDFGIKHVVLSSGTRNINLTRLFEANSCFITHSVIDERSAGFYALGIASQLKQPVVMCCTSGTATSNYLSALTEAFYRQIPLIAITADRYPCFLNQMEDQMIPQPNMYGNVCKKSITLPTGDGPLSDWEARRLVSETLIETKHHGQGPVHINVPIISIERAKPPKENLVLDKEYRHIELITRSDSFETWKNRVKRLSIMKKILVIYGQNKPATEELLNAINNFTKIYRCAILTDHLSNIHCDNAVFSRNLLSNISQIEFDKDLAPDIVITVGGRLTPNHPIIGKLKAQRPNLGHWRVNEDGIVSDPFRKLSRVFECSAEYFFNFFYKHAFNNENNDDYANRWKQYEERYKTIEKSSYSTSYAIEQTIKNIPDYSCIHYGLGVTVRAANRIKLKSNIEAFCNLGVNGIDGVTSTYMGASSVTDKLCFLIVGDLSFFYDMNALWSKKLTGNLRIMMINNNGTDLLRHHSSPSVTHEHSTTAEGWVTSLGFEYLFSYSKDDFDTNIKRFCSNENTPMFFEVFV